MERNENNQKIEGIFRVYGREYYVALKWCTTEFSGLSKETKEIEFWAYNIEPWPKVPGLSDEKKRKMIYEDYDALMSIIKEHYIL